MVGQGRPGKLRVELHRPLPRDSSAPGRARRLVHEFLAPHPPDREAVENSSLVVSELVTNALKHGRGAISLMLRLQDHRLLVEVTDQGDHPERVARRRSGPDGGWGLHLVDALATRWGVYEGTTHVWAEIALSSP